MRMYEDDYYNDEPTLIEQLIEEKRRKGLLPKTSYTKKEVVAMLTELQLEIEKLDTPNNGNAYLDCAEIIQQKIDKLRGIEE